MLRRAFFAGLSAGVMITIGAGTFLACDNRYVGAVMFSVALMVICMLGMYLYTGKIGLLAEDFSGKGVLCVIFGLLGNYITATLGGLLLGAIKRDFYEKAQTMCQNKLTQEWFITIALGVMCGILMYAAVKGYAKSSSPLVIIFCVAVFIISGYEHSIADMAYFAIAHSFSLQYGVYILLVVLGNTIGGLLIPVLMRIGRPKEIKGEA